MLDWRARTIVLFFAVIAIGCGKVTAAGDVDAGCTDADSDGVCDADDACPGADDSVDADGDGAPDGCDACPGADDGQDADRDGIPDGCDVCAGDDTVDSDGDTVPDDCDVCTGDDTVDADGDTVPDDCDVCPGFDDAIDTDSDGVPDGCDIANLLIAHGNASGGFLDCVVAGLAPFYTSVTAVGDVPTSDQLAAADAVLVYNNGSHADPVSLGNVLADFFDAKGHVVEAIYGTGGLGGLAGRWSTDGYRVLDGAWVSTAVNLGTVVEPGSPLMTGVTTLGSSRTVDGGAINGGIVVATWSSGTPVVVRGVKSGFNRVDLGMFPGGCSGDIWTGDGFALMRNAIEY